MHILYESSTQTGKLDSTMTDRQMQKKLSKLQMNDLSY